MGRLMFMPIYCDKYFYRAIYEWDGTEPTDGKPFHSLYAVTVGGMQISYILIFNVVWVAMLIITMIKGVRLMYSDERDRSQVKASLLHQVIGILVLLVVVNVVSYILKMFQS